jgi:phospholipase/carboxylesterase
MVLRDDGNSGAHRSGLENRTVMDDGMINRRDFLRLTAGAASVGLLAACDSGREGLKGQQQVESASGRGRLRARAGPPSSNAAVSTGLHPVRLGSTRDGLLYVPAGYGEKALAPLALALHGAGGSARSGISHFLHLADEAGLVLLAPESRGRTWDVLVSGYYGPDVEFIDQTLKWALDRLALDTRKLAITGFSDGASYALSLGLTNGDLFTHVMAFSPGFMAPANHRGKPPVFVSHGTHDRVLPIERCSRRIVPQLDRAGYQVRYREFDGAHTVPESIARDALRWFNSDEGSTDVEASKNSRM